ncbi:hypothetical protein GCM10009779_27570 [Polymorphospora rubra]
MVTDPATMLSSDIVLIPGIEDAMSAGERWHLPRPGTDLYLQCSGVGMEDGMTSVDILIMTALQEEYSAARTVGSTLACAAGRPTQWQDRDRGAANPYEYTEIAETHGGVLAVALARPVRMGGRSISPAAAGLVERLKPQVLAMSGVCAGNPKVAALGDVVVAEMVYEYDEGKQIENAFLGDHRQIPMEQTWVRAAQDFSPIALPSYGEVTRKEARLWFLERLYAADEPRDHLARPRYFPRGNWDNWVRELETDGLINRNGPGWTLTDDGRRFIERKLYDDVGGPERLPFAVHVGPMASGSFVVKDGVTWDRLGQQGVRTVVGLEMESATIATVAQHGRVPHWLVVKGVMDHADPSKDDRYKRFAAQASAEVLFALLTDLLVPRTESLGVAGQAKALPTSSPVTDDHSRTLRQACDYREDHAEELAESSSGTPPPAVDRDAADSALDHSIVARSSGESVGDTLSLSVPEDETSAGERRGSTRRVLKRIVAGTAISVGVVVVLGFVVALKAGEVDSPLRYAEGDPYSSVPLSYLGGGVAMRWTLDAAPASSSALETTFVPTDSDENALSLSGHLVFEEKLPCEPSVRWTISLEEDGVLGGGVLERGNPVDMSHVVFSGEESLRWLTLTLARIDNSTCSADVYWVNGGLDQPGWF